MNPLNASLTQRVWLAAAACFATLAIGCGGGPAGSSGNCDGAKCDTPDQTAAFECQVQCTPLCQELADGGELDQELKQECVAEGQSEFDRGCFDECRLDAAFGFCELRESDALKSSQLAFRRDSLRWACADVEGVTSNANGDSRGQEYCEYFAIIQPPPNDDGELLPSVELGKNFRDSNGVGQTPASLELSRDQKDMLEDAGTAVVGQCIFTTWHADIGGELPVCDSEGGCPQVGYGEGAELPEWETDTVLDTALTADNFRMKVGFNSNGAAADLVEKCLQNPREGDVDDPTDIEHRPYIRGCMKAFELFGTEWRRSDSEVCVAGARLSECGCRVEIPTFDEDGNPGEPTVISDPVEIGKAMVPRSRRGFQLSTWSEETPEWDGEDALPPGCRFIPTGDSEFAQNIVSCDITANELINKHTDPKGFCRDRYGQNVVVHVPIPADLVKCDGSNSQYGSAQSCGETPWVVEAPAEDEGGEGDEGDEGDE